MFLKLKSENEKLYYRYLSEDKMFYIKGCNWLDDDMNRGAIGDSLWRTSMAYMAYNDNDLLTGVKSCFRKFKMINKKGKYWYQLSRSTNRYSEDDVSRDQTIMALTSLKFHNQEELLTEYASHIPYKLSRRFNMTPTMYFWVKALYKNNKFYNFMFQLLLVLELLISYSITKPLRRWAGFNNTNIYTELKEKKETIIYKIYDSIKYPGYATHLSSWMFYSVKKIPILSYLLKKVFEWEIEKNSYLLQMLIGNTVDINDINNYKSREEWRWSGKFNGDYNYIVLNDIEGAGNNLDKDICYSIYNKII